MTSGPCDQAHASNGVTDVTGVAAVAVALCPICADSMITEEKHAYRKLFFRDHARHRARMLLSGSAAWQERTLCHMVWPFRNRGMVERTCLQCGQIWVLKAAMAGRKPRRAPRVSVGPDLRYAQTHSPLTQVGTDQFLAASHLDDAGAEDKDSQLFRELQVCPKCSASRYTQRRIHGRGDSAAPGASPGRGG